MNMIPGLVIIIEVGLSLLIEILAGRPILGQLPLPAGVIILLSIWTLIFHAEVE